MRFRKVIGIILLGAVFAACSPAGEGDTGAAQTEAARPSEYVFSYKGVSVSVNGSFEEIYAGLGKENSFSSEKSCAFDGDERCYNYGSFSITTYEDNGAERVMQISLRDDTVETPEGVCIGQSRQDVISAYGEGDGNDFFMDYKGEGMILSFSFKDGTVSDIRYLTTVTKK